MITKKVLLKTILFHNKPNEILKQSILQRGMAIPVRVNEVEEGYVCLDGHQNNFKKAGSGFWGHTQNHH